MIRKRNLILQLSGLREIINKQFHIGILFSNATRKKQIVTRNNKNLKKNLMFQKRMKMKCKYKVEEQ